MSYRRNRTKKDKEDGSVERDPSLSKKTVTLDPNSLKQGVSPRGGPGTPTNLNSIQTSEWKNIPIPVTEAIESLIREIK